MIASTEIVESLRDIIKARNAEIAELRLTLANERGQGAPPSEGWEWHYDGWRYPDKMAEVYPGNAMGWMWWARGQSDARHADTAREAMRLATAALEERR